MANRCMTESEVIAYERQLSEQLKDCRTRDLREDRHTAFITGWNKANKGGDYKQSTLKRLTWNNLGYRMRKEFGPQSNEQRDWAYTVLAEHRKRFLEEQQESSDAVSDAVIERKLVERLEQKRDRREAAALKQRYNNACMFCGTQLQVAKDRFYSEAAHIRGLGKPDNGPDNRSNMLVLCPNHHIQFDWGVLRLHKVGDHYQIKSKAVADPLGGKKITLIHSIDDDCVKYHHERFK